MIGAYALELKSANSFFEPLRLFKGKFFKYILISLLGNSISAILDKILVQYTNYYTIMFVFYAFLTVIYFAILIFKRESEDILKISTSKQIITVCLITVAALLADLTYFAAVAIPTTAIVILIPLRRLSTFISTILGGSVFKEKNIVYKGLICLVMIVGVYLLVI
jgi:uncharacterized membrane protein